MKTILVLAIEVNDSCEDDMKQMGRMILEEVRHMDITGVSPNGIGILENGCLYDYTVLKHDSNTVALGELVSFDAVIN